MLIWAHVWFAIAFLVCCCPALGGRCWAPREALQLPYPCWMGTARLGRELHPSSAALGMLLGGAAWGLLSSFPQLRFILALSLCFLFVPIQTSSVTFSSFPPPFVPLCACPNPFTAPSSFQPAAPSPPLGFLGATSSSSNCHLNHFPKTDVTCKEFIEGLGRQDRTCPHLLHAQVSNPSAALLLM